MILSRKSLESAINLWTLQRTINLSFSCDQTKQVILRESIELHRIRSIEGPHANKWIPRRCKLSSKELSFSGRSSKNTNTLALPDSSLYFVHSSNILPRRSALTYAIIPFISATNLNSSICLQASLKKSESEVHWLDLGDTSWRWIVSATEAVFRPNCRAFRTRLSDRNQGLASTLRQGLAKRWSGRIERSFCFLYGGTEEDLCMVLITTLIFMHVYQLQSPGFFSVDTFQVPYANSLVPNFYCIVPAPISDQTPVAALGFAQPSNLSSGSCGFLTTQVEDEPKSSQEATTLVPVKSEGTPDNELRIPEKNRQEK